MDAYVIVQRPHIEAGIRWGGRTLEVLCNYGQLVCIVRRRGLYYEQMIVNVWKVDILTHATNIVEQESYERGVAA